MNTRRLILYIFALFSAASAQAQWQSTTYSLKGGWNSIYLHGDATHATPDVLFAAYPEVLEVWRWNPNPDQVQFTQSPLIPSSGTPEWSVWKRDGSVTALSQMVGQSAYLVKCSGTAASSYSVVIPQRPLPPSSIWVRNGANLLGFPTYKNGANYPTFSNYFATFPAAIAANAKIYKYVGGDLGPANPLQVFSPTSEKLDRNAAYWFSAEVVGNFYAPLEISLTTPGGLSFGRTGDEIVARIRNRTAAPVTLTLTPQMSDAPPSGQNAVTGPVPLTRRLLNTTTLVWEETAISGAYTEVIGPQSTVELHLGINRAHPTMSGASAGALFASFLRLTDSGNLMDVYLPASASKASLAGLWVGDITLTGVGSKVSNGANASATVVNGAVTGVSVSGSGGSGYPTSTVTLDSTAGLKRGMLVSGPGTSGTVTITSITDETHLVLSQNVPSGTVPLSYGTPVVLSSTSSTSPPDPSIVTVPSTAELKPGLTVTGPGVSGTVTISSITSGTQIVLSGFIPDATNDLTYSDVRLSDIQGPAPIPVIIAAPPAGGTQALGRAVVDNGSITGVIITNAGSGYQVNSPAVSIGSPPPLSGNSTPRPFHMRTLLHIADDGPGTARLLSQVFLGVLANTPTEVGLCTQESGLQQDAKATARRLVAAHMPLDQVIGGTGTVTIPGALTRTVQIPYNDATNPFVHAFHPDHDNKDARFQPVAAGVESYDVTRSCTFVFTASPPSGSTVSTGWGSRVIGGTYNETLSGIHKETIQLSGTFELRLAAEIGTLVTP